VALGLLRGLAEGFYWSGFHLVTYDTTCERDRDRYFGAQASATWFLTALLPPAAGAVIVAGTHVGGPYRGYELIFALAAVVLMAAMVLAGRLPSAARERLSARRVMTLVRRNPDWHWVTRARLADGFTGSLMGLVLTILTYLVLKNEQQVGNFNGLMGLLGVAICLGLGRVLSIGCFLLLAAPMNQMLLARIVVAVAGAAPIIVWAAFARIPQPTAIPEVDNRALPAAA